MNIKKALLTGTSYAAVAAVAIGGTVAYLSDSESDINVMTAGNVSIVQNEYQRVLNADGTYATDTIDDRKSYVLEAFEQDKLMLPTTEDSNHGAGPWDGTPVRMSQVGSYGGMSVFESENAVDKFVTVENDGSTDAYVRTLVAIEIGETDGSLFGVSYHNTWTQNSLDETIVVDDVTYMVYEYVYQGAQLSDGTWRHENGILTAGDTTYPSLSQVYINSIATNEDMAKIDKNGDGDINILVLSQAVQADGFDNATDALDEAFGDVDATNATEWFTDVVNNG